MIKYGKLLSFIKLYFGMYYVLILEGTPFPIRLRFVFFLSSVSKCRLQDFMSFLKVLRPNSRAFVFKSKNGVSG